MTIRDVEPGKVVLMLIVVVVIFRVVWQLFPGIHPFVLYWTMKINRA